LNFIVNIRAKDTLTWTGHPFAYTTALRTPLALTSDPIHPTNNPPRIMTSVTIEGTYVINRGVSNFIHCFRNLCIRQLHPCLLTLLLTSTLALQTLPAISSDMDLDKATNTPPPLRLDHSLCFPGFLHSQSLFRVVFTFQSFHFAKIFLVVIAKVISEVVFAGKWHVQSLAFVIVARKSVLIINLAVNVFVMPLEICGPAENDLLAQASPGVLTWVLPLLWVSERSRVLAYSHTMTFQQNVLCMIKVYFPRGFGGRREGRLELEVRLLAFPHSERIKPHIW